MVHGTSDTSRVPAWRPASSPAATGWPPTGCTRRETGAAPADRSPPNSGRHDGGHPDVSAAVEGRLDRGGDHARFPDIRDRRQWGSRDLDGAVVATVAGSRL